MTLLAKLQTGSVGLAVAGGVLGFLTAGGCSATPTAPPGWAGPVHLLLLLVSALGGICAAFRIREVETARWQAVNDPLATKGEREYAHREAESQRRWAATAFLLGPIGVAFWLAYAFETPGRFSLSDLFLVTPMAAFLIALLTALRSIASRPPSA